MNTGHEDRILIIHEVFSGVIHNYQQVFIPRGKHWYKVMEILIWMSLITAIVDKNNNKCLRYWNIGVSNQKWGQNAPRSPPPPVFRITNINNFSVSTSGRAARYIPLPLLEGIRPLPRFIHFWILRWQWRLWLCSLLNAKLKTDTTESIL